MLSDFGLNRRRGSLASTENALDITRRAVRRATRLVHNNQYYDDHAADYAARTLRAPHPTVIEPFIAALPRGASVVDLGCGAGRELAVLAGVGFDVVGYDMSPALAEIARAKTHAPVLVADMRDMRLPPASLDGVIAVASLLHLAPEELAPMLIEVARWVRTGGLFLTTMKLGSGSEVDLLGRRFIYFDSMTWRALLARAGFEIVAETTSAPSVGVSSSGHAWLGTIARKRT